MSQVLSLSIRVARRTSAGFVACAAAAVLLAVAGGVACSPVRAPEADAPVSPAAGRDVGALPSFENIVWRVAESPNVAPGHLYVFLSDGTLVVTSPQSTPSLGRWRRIGDGLSMIEQDIEYRVDIVSLSHDEFRIHIRDPGDGVDIRFVPASPR